MIATVAQFLSWIGLDGRSASEELVRSVVIDSREAGPGAVFFALPGETVDGHGFIQAALDRGAALAVIDAAHPSAATWNNHPQIAAVASPLRALQDAAQAYRAGFDIPVLAVTGSNGKTTTKEMMRTVLSADYRVACTTGNLNNHLGVPLSILSWPKDAELAIVEMGTNHFGEIRRLCEIARPTHGVITNIGKGHLEFFHDLDGVAKAKGELLESLAPAGQAFLNGDDPHLVTRRDVVARTVTYGFSEDCDLRARDLGPDALGRPGMDVDGHTVRVPLFGRHNLMNALAATAVARAFGVEWPAIQDALQGFQPVGRRSQAQTAGGVTVINDAYNANPSSMAEALAALAQMPGTGRRVAVLGDMAEVGEASAEEHRLLGELVLRLHLDALFTSGKAMALAHAQAQESGLAEARHFVAHDELVSTLLDSLREGDIVLVKGSRSAAMDRVADALVAALNR